MPGPAPLAVPERLSQPQIDSRIDTTVAVRICFTARTLPAIRRVRRQCLPVTPGVRLGVERDGPPFCSASRFLARWIDLKIVVRQLCPVCDRCDGASSDVTICKAN